LRNALLASATAQTLTHFLAQLPPTDLETLQFDWQIWARDDQLPPRVAATGEPWRTWLFIGGRGAGKTRAGAEWIRGEAQALAGVRPKRLALIGPTIQHVRAVMIEGVSGLLAIHPEQDRPIFEPSKNQLTWPNGTIGQMFSADEYETLRGPQFDAAWCDELCRWKKAQAAWDMLQLALRMGETPRAVITTTPKSSPTLKRIISDPSTAVTHATTSANAANLSPVFLAEVTRRYAGTATGMQELEGQIIEDHSGGLWRREWFDQNRVAAAPELSRIVVAVDPPVSAGASADACGIVVAGLGVDGRGYVLADRTIHGREPQIWARAAVAAWRDFQADRIVAEVNQGGDLVVLVLQQVDPTVTVRKVRASRGKWLRAEPVAALYAEGRIAHVGEFLALENQMVAFDGTPASAGTKSPDRLDALVWAFTDLMITSGTKPTVRAL
jgi:phage terminase large subunit-like protein